MDPLRDEWVLVKDNDIICRKFDLINKNLRRKGPTVVVDSVPIYIKLP